MLRPQISDEGIIPSSCFKKEKNSSSEGVAILPRRASIFWFRRSNGCASNLETHL
uniref:Uncharacterized protein n=1 Tax=Arundo donax TaxID=35708 RepID=A0A0A9BLR3_ARUDO